MVNNLELSPMWFQAVDHVVYKWQLSPTCFQAATWFKQLLLFSYLEDPLLGGLLLLVGLFHLDRVDFDMEQLVSEVFVEDELVAVLHFSASGNLKWIKGKKVKKAVL